MTYQQPPLAIDRAIVRCLIQSPRTLNELASQLKAHDFAELCSAVRRLRDDGTLACTGKRWFLRGLVRGELIKVQDRARELQEIFNERIKSK